MILVMTVMAQSEQRIVRILPRLQPLPIICMMNNQCFFTTADGALPPVTSHNFLTFDRPPFVLQFIVITHFLSRFFFFIATLPLFLLFCACSLGESWERSTVRFLRFWPRLEPSSLSDVRSPGAIPRSGACCETLRPTGCNRLDELTAVRYAPSSLSSGRALA